MQTDTNAESEQAAWCVHVSASSWGIQRPPHHIVYDNVHASWDIAMLSLRSYYSPCCSPSFFMTLCATTCFHLSSHTVHTSHCIRPCWLSSILHFSSPTLEAAWFQTTKMRGGQKLPSDLLDLYWLYITHGHGYPDIFKHSKNKQSSF